MTVDYQVTSPDLDRIRDMLASYPQIASSVLTRAMSESVVTVASNIKREMQRPTNRGESGVMGRPIDQGRLIGAIGGHVETIGGTVGAISDIRGVVDAGGVEYAAAVELGTRPHWMPIAPLKRWAKLKLGDERAAYAVQASIAKRGTKGYFMFARGWERSKRWVSQRFRRALSDIVNTMRRHGGTGRGAVRRTAPIPRRGYRG